MVLQLVCAFQRQLGKLLCLSVGHSRFPSHSVTLLEWPLLTLCHLRQGVGHMAVQLAKSLGLHVAAVAGPANAAWVKEALGADAVVDYAQKVRGLG